MGAAKKKSMEQADLRRRAEDRLKTIAQNPGDFNSATLAHPAHELSVYQIELEMQNEELRRTQVELERSRDQYTELYEYAPVSYLTLDPQGSICTANLAATNFLLVARSHLIGTQFVKFVAEENRSAFSDFLNRAFARQEKESCEIWLYDQDEKKHYVQIEALADTSAEQCRIVVLDITIRRKFEESLILLADLEARAKELESFNYTVSHDLRTPLTIISGYSELLLKLCHDKIDEECQGFLEEISDSALRMGKLIQTLLNFAQLSRLSLQLKSVNLSKVAEKVVAALRQTDYARQVEVRVKDGILAYCDAGLMKVVLDNLIGNAWKFTDLQPFAIIEFGSKQLDGKQVFFVRDNGQGFAAEHSEKLFMPFQRVPELTGEGYGIGLATAARIIQCHGGQIWAESEPGKGATFFFTLECSR